MKFRDFTLKEDITQLEYVTFRAKVEELKPEAWNGVENLPIELLYDVLVRSAIHAGWVQDVVEENEYEEETIWAWNVDYIDGLPAGKWPLAGWGHPVFERWMEYRTLDPN